jgi:hypothetical protein
MTMKKKQCKLSVLQIAPNSACAESNDVIINTKFKSEIKDFQSSHTWRQK